MAKKHDNFDHLDLDLDALNGAAGGGSNKTPEEIEAEKQAAEEAQRLADEEEARKKKEKEDQDPPDETEEEKAARLEKEKAAAAAEGDEGDEDDDDDDSFVKQLQTSFGFEELSEEEFEDSEEGLQQLTVKASQLMAQKAMDNLFQQDPVLAKHFEFKQKGGDSKEFIDTFYPEKDWTKVALPEEDDEDESQLVNIVKQDLLDRGFSEDEAKETVADFKVANTLRARAESSLNNLKGRQNAKQEQLIANQQAKLAADQKAAEDSWTKVTETVNNSTSLSGLPIKQAEKQSFIDYLNKPVNKEGKTQRELDMQAMKLDQALALDFLLYKKFDISKLVDTKAKTQQAGSLRDKLKGNKVGGSKTKSPGKGTGKTVDDTIKNIDWDKIK